MSRYGDVRGLPVHGCLPQCHAYGCFDHILNVTEIRCMILFHYVVTLSVVTTEIYLTRENRKGELEHCMVGRWSILLRAILTVNCKI